jgi:hypothetical protein
MTRSAWATGSAGVRARSNASFNRTRELQRPSLVYVHASFSPISAGFMKYSSGFRARRIGKE